MRVLWRERREVVEGKARRRGSWAANEGVLDMELRRKSKVGIAWNFMVSLRAN